ncbi:MAG TPA: deoxyribodipyrimidine photo-lyase [Bauldia sp.]|nr:deoxyribodipyrimidine photo-lyase [Bauldia sp.]
MANLVWLRDDLRLADNPALAAASARAEPTCFVYVLDEESPGLRPFGAAQRWWLHYAVAGLAADLSRKGQRLVLRRGAAAKVIPTLAAAIGADRVFWNRRYGHGAIVDEKVRLALRRRPVETFSANLLFEPSAIQNDEGKPFRAFSAFWRRAASGPAPRQPRPSPRRLPPPVQDVSGDQIEDWRLIPTAPDWSGRIRGTWQPGERGARKRLAAFIAASASRYATERDRPGSFATSMLSPHLRFGEISPHQLWHAVEGAAAGKIRSELGWREFAWHTLDAFPDMAKRNINQAFDALPWEEPYEDDMWAWRRGRTGFPIVDAGMRQLWQTGWMHNRVRMIAASFLTKDLLVDWRLGEAWFWDTLVDADPANNPFNWQWVAGTGLHAQPFFRIFNPVLQGERFDPDGAYVRTYVPELAALPAKYIHKPWAAPEHVLTRAGVRLGETYPLPLADHSAARARALNAFLQIRQKRNAQTL